MVRISVCLVVGIGKIVEEALVGVELQVLVKRWLIIFSQLLFELASFDQTSFVVVLLLKKELVFVKLQFVVLRVVQIKIHQLAVMLRTMRLFPPF